jgi:hypothetical protein
MDCVSFASVEGVSCVCFVIQNLSLWRHRDGDAQL